MPAKKGTRPPNAGKRGRKPGTPNRVTRSTRELFSAFVDHNAAKAQALFDRVARRNPAMALRLLASFAEFSLPRLQRTELDATIAQTHTFPAFEDADEGDAEHTYLAMLRVGKGGPAIEIAPPLHPPEYYEQKRAAAFEAGRPSLSPPPSPKAVAGPPEPSAASFAAAAPTAEPPPAPAAPGPSRVAVDPDDPSVVAVIDKQDEILRWQRPAYIVT